MTADVEHFVLRLKRPDTDFFRKARRVYDVLSRASIPVPQLFKPLGRLLYGIRLLVPRAWKRFKAMVYTTPLFTCRCESVGKRLKLTHLPSVTGHTLLYIKDDLRLSGSLVISSGKFRERPTLRIGNRVFIGHNVGITCNEEVTIEDDVLIAANCRISDSDCHAAELQKRITGSDLGAEEIRPVRICRGAWIGFGASILKGVTIGEGSIVGTNSVVTNDVPPYCVVAGSPARVVKQAMGNAARAA